VLKRTHGHLQHGGWPHLCARPAGRLDLLAIDPEGNYVVIELKARTAEEKVLVQLLKHVRWVKQQLAGEKSVRGTEVANGFGEGSK
jgi:RecB family endonuclease NucS